MFKNTLLKYFRVLNHTLSFEDKEISIEEQKCPQQPNSYDCGVFAMLFAYRISVICQPLVGMHSNYTFLKRQRNLIKENLELAQFINPFGKAHDQDKAE